MVANGDGLEPGVRARLRQIRFEQGLTLAQVAVGAGMATSTVSRLESGARGLTLAHCERLAVGLGVEAARLVGQAQEVAPEPDRNGRVWRPLVDEGDRALRVYRIELPDGSHDAVMSSHEGHVLIVVLSGRLRLITDTSVDVLHPGEAVAFNTWTLHWMGAIAEPADILAVFAPDGQSVHYRRII